MIKLAVGSLSFANIRKKISTLGYKLMKNFLICRQERAGEFRTSPGVFVLAGMVEIMLILTLFCVKKECYTVILSIKIFWTFRFSMIW